MYIRLNGFIILIFAYSNIHLYNKEGKKLIKLYRFRLKIFIFIFNRLRVLFIAEPFLMPSIPDSLMTIETDFLQISYFGGK